MNSNNNTEFFDEYSNNYLEFLSFKNINNKQFSIDHQKKYQKVRQNYNWVCELVEIIQGNYPQIVNAQIDNRIAYLYKIRSQGFDAYYKSLEFTENLNNNVNNQLCHVDLQPDDISPNRHLVFLYEFESLQE